MEFEKALIKLKEKFRVSRMGWNGPNQWIRAQFPDEHSKMSVPYLYLKNAQDNLVPWIPSQGDLFAEDWFYIKDHDQK